MSSSTPVSALRFPGDSEMARRMREFDWSNGSLGPVERWPQSLRTMVSTCLECAFPFVLWWGPDLVTIYNDAYRSVLGEKHPAALGAPCEIVWSEIWHDMEPRIAQVMRQGKSTRPLSFPMQSDRRGNAAKDFRACSYSPIYDESGRVAGVFCPLVESVDRGIESEQRVTRILESITDAFQVFDADWRFVYMNPSARQFFLRHGLDPEAMIGKRFWDDLFPEMREGDSARQMRRAMNERVPVAFENYYAPWDAWQMSRFDPLPDGGLANYFQDITEKKRHEEGQRANERRLATELADMERLQEVSTRLVQAGDGSSLLLDILDAAIAVNAADMGNIQLLDRESGALRIVASRGFSRSFRDFFDSVQNEQATHGTAMHRGERVIVDDVAKSPLFVSTPSLDVMLEAGALSMQSTPLITRSGRLVGMLSTHYRSPQRPVPRDLHVLDLLARQAADWIERTDSEDELRESEERFRSLVAQVKDYAIFSTDERGRISSWNEGCQHVLGYTEAEFVGLDGEKLFTPEDRKVGVLAALLREISDTGSVRDDRWMLANGGRRFFSMGAATRLRDATGRVIGFSVVMRDMTDMKLAQDDLAHRGESLARLVSERTDELVRATERLRISERMAALGTLAAGLGHDLGNLLLPLEVRLQILEQANLEPELRDHVTGIANCVQYLERLSGGLRLLSTDPRESRFTEPTEIGAWWMDVDMLIKNVLPRSVTFDEDMTSSEAWVSVGRVGLTHAVFNIVQNAADALRDRPSGHVRIAVEAGPRPSTLAIRVTDDGPGMSDEVIRRCTEPYFSTKARGSSTGMGLALVHALVAAAGGHVDISSTFGVGTSVSLVLPGAKLAARPYAGARRPRVRRQSRRSAK